MINQLYNHYIHIYIYIYIYVEKKEQRSLTSYIYIYIYIIKNILHIYGYMFNNIFNNLFSRILLELKYNTILNVSRLNLYVLTFTQKKVFKVI